ncbi:BTAD domain-containing putative transcriptional regulator [Streptomyces platensis]|uniref:AfsR/SARP family transcriptional regulator n=1 Tax=Streptomyces platensis TaxID=58346 RepID=UPI0037908105
MRFQILGPVEAWQGQTQILLGGPKLRTAFAALLLARGRVVSNSQLTSLLWGEVPPATWAAQIHTYMSRLRQSIGPAAQVIRQRPGYLLRMPPARSSHETAVDRQVTVDFLEFERLAAQGRAAANAGDAAAASEILRAALATWIGPVLGGVTDPLAEYERPHLEESRLSVLEERIDADLALGRHGELIAELIELTTVHPLRERLRGQLMTALYRCDRQADALAVFQEGRQALAESLGIDPGPTLRNLHQAVLVNDPALAHRAQPPTAGTANVGTPHVPPPAPPADFTGRQAQVSELRELLSSPGKRTGPSAVGAIVGMPGVGKTAVALQVAHGLAAQYPDGQVFVDLRGSRSDPLTAAEAMGEILSLLGMGKADLPAGDERRGELYRGHLLSRKALLILDDVADEAQVRTLLPGVGSCGVLLTSRTRLSALPGIRPVSLGAFSPDDAQQLLQSIVGAERMAAQPEEARAIIECCARLPLAVRIAGSRLAARPQWPLDRLTKRLADPLLRIGELRIADLALSDVLASGYDRLPPPARRALRLLSLIESPAFSTWTAALLLDLPLDAADDVIDQLLAAHVADLVQDDGTGQPVYALHGLMRSYVRGRAAVDGSAAERREALERLNRPTRVSYRGDECTDDRHQWPLD